MSGGLFGLLVALHGLPILTAFLPFENPHAIGSSVDEHVLGFTAGLIIVAVLLFGLIPAIRISTPNLQQALKAGDRRTGPGTGSRRLSRTLVVVEMALALVLVIGAGLLIKSMWNLTRVDLGFRADPDLMVLRAKTLEVQTGESLSRGRLLAKYNKHHDEAHLSTVSLPH